MGQLCMHLKNRSVTENACILRTIFPFTSVSSALVEQKRQTERNILVMH